MQTAEEVSIATELLGLLPDHLLSSLTAFLASNTNSFFIMSPHSINTSPKIKDCWIIQSWIHPADGLLLSLDRNFLNLCMLGWNSHVEIIWAISTVCAATVSMRTLGAVKVWTWNCEIWNAKYYSNDQCINLHAERREMFQEWIKSVLILQLWVT